MRLCTRDSSPRISRSSLMRSTRSACSWRILSASSAEALQREVEDRLRLDAREAELLDQAAPRRVRIARAADEGDHLVEVVERNQAPLEDVHALLGAAQLVLRAAHYHVALVTHVRIDDARQRERARDAVDERDGVDAEGRLHRRVLVELVQGDLRDR